MLIYELNDFHLSLLKKKKKKKYDSLTRETRLRYTWRIPSFFNVESLYPE